MTRSRFVRLVLQPSVFVLCALPFLRLVRGAWTGDLGANPVDTLTQRTGIWALGLLVLSLGVTPARRLLRFSELLGIRRTLGLYAFFYATLHLLTWAIFDHQLAVAEMWVDIVKRPYITAGMMTFALLLPLATTSTQAMIRRLGSRWQVLHRLAYLAAVTGVLHYWWLVKADIRQPRQFAVAVVALLAYRAWAIAGRRLGRRSRGRAAAFPRQTPASGEHSWSGDRSPREGFSPPAHRS